MKSNKLKIISLTISMMLVQVTCVAYAASSSNKDTYTSQDFENITPGFGAKDIDISNKKVDFYTNTFSSAKPPSIDDEKTSDSKTTPPTSGTTDSSVANAIESSVPSTGRKGDFWGKTKGGKWILIEQGVPVSGWKNVRGNWYYMDPDGVMQTGWINDGDNWYYLNSDGSMAYNTYVGGYYLDSSGAMQ